MKLEKTVIEKRHDGTYFRIQKTNIGKIIETIDKVLDFILGGI